MSSNANRVDATGIVVESLADIVNGIINGTIVNDVTVKGLKDIYGTDINVDPNTPDGNMVNIPALAKSDILQFCVGIYDSFDPDQAIGVALDQISAICGAIRNAGTYTQVYVLVTVAQALTIDGLSDPTKQPYTAQDENGNKFYLVTSHSFSGAGSASLLFQAADIGAVQVSANSITTPVTVIPGVSTLNNPLGASQQGVDEETDAQFRIRRQKSTALPGQGWLPSMLAQLLQIDGIVSAVVFENYTNAEDGDGIPAHYIWVVVDGGSDADVAAVIYAGRNAGAGMKGTQEVVITQVDSSEFTVKFDRAQDEDLYVRFYVYVLGPGSYDEDALKTQLSQLYKLDINQPADVSSIISLIKTINPTLVIAGCEVSDNGTDWIDSDILPEFKNYRFVLTADRVTILVGTSGFSG